MLSCATTWYILTSLTKKLKRFGFTITKRSPQFSPDQLDNYYSDIKNGWWHDVFCNDIHFWGIDGKLVEESFRALASNPAYHDAFYK